MKNPETMLVELKGTFVLSEMTAAFCENMSERQYDEALRLLCAMATITAALALSKDAAEVPSPDEIISRTNVAIAVEQDNLRDAEAHNVRR